MSKKINLRVTAIMMVAIVSIGFVSCGDDDEKVENGVSLVGTWSLNFDGGSCLLIFSQDGTCNYQEYDHGKWETPKTYKYTYKDNILSFTYYSESRHQEETETIEVISLSESILILKDWPDGGINKFNKQ